MKTVKYLNEKGNVSGKVRDGVRAQMNAKLAAMLTEQFDDVVPNANGGYAVPVAVDEKSGDTLYATVNFTLSLKDPAAKVERKKADKGDRAEKPAEEELPDLF